MVAEGEELQTNLLQVSQRGPASSSVLDEVFGTHRWFGRAAFFGLGDLFRYTATLVRKLLTSLRRSPAASSTNFDAVSTVCADC